MRKYHFIQRDACELDGPNNLVAELQYSNHVGSHRYLNLWASHLESLSRAAGVHEDGTQTLSKYSSESWARLSLCRERWERWAEAWKTDGHKTCSMKFSYIARMSDKRSVRGERSVEDLENYKPLLGIDNRLQQAKEEFEEYTTRISRDPKRVPLSG